MRLERNFRSLPADAGPGQHCPAGRHLGSHCRPTGPAAGEPAEGGALLRPGREAGASPMPCWLPSEAGRGLRDQAVLMRAARHSHVLEVELTAASRCLRQVRRVEVPRNRAHEGLPGRLRTVANPRDEISWFRLLRLHHDIGRAGRAGAAAAVGGQATSRVRERGDRTGRPRVDAAVHAGWVTAAGRAAIQSSPSRPGVPPVAAPAGPGPVPRLASGPRTTSTARRFGRQPDLAAFVAEVTLDPAAASRTTPSRLRWTTTTSCCPPSTPPRAWNGRPCISLHVVDGAFPSDMALDR